jgi:hypothetical protein
MIEKKVLQFQRKKKRVLEAQGKNLKIEIIKKGQEGIILDQDQQKMAIKEGDPEVGITKNHKRRVNIKKYKFFF